jgi:hypothetical protein
MPQGGAGGEAMSTTPGLIEAKYALTLLTDKALCELIDEQDRAIEKDMQTSARAEVDRLRFYYRLSLEECRRRALGY